MNSGKVLPSAARASESLLDGMHLVIASRPVDLIRRITFVSRVTHSIKRYLKNAVEYRTMDLKETDVIKVQQIFHRFSNDKTDDFDVNRKHVMSFCLTYLSNTTLNVTLEQLQSLLKQPEIKG